MPYFEYENSSIQYLDNYVAKEGVSVSHLGGLRLEQILQIVDENYVPLSVPAFLAYNTVDDSLTVDTNTTVDFDKEIFDNGGDFSGDTFTAPEAGKYQFNITVRINDIDIDATNYQVRLVTSNRTYYTVESADYNADRLYKTFCFSVLADMDEGDTAFVQVRQVGGASVSTIEGQSLLYTRFSGFKASQ